MSEREYSERPWGNYTVLDDDAPDHKVKRLVVHPGKRLSYQRHSKRAEHWFIVSGTATVTLDGTVTTVEAGQSIDIPLEGAHRIANEGDTDVVFIEVQRGTYFGEDDIVRLEDDYGRVADMTRIAELLAAGPTYSFEFFPPKNDKELGTLARTIAELQPLEPSFVSVTYRGGAESRQRTFDLVSGMLHTTKLNPMAHLICVAHTRLELADILVSLRKAGVENLMALGGDPPEDPSRRPRRTGLRGGAGAARPRHRRLLHRRGGPPGRPPALAGMASDRDYLAAKLELADFGVTQFFFEASEYEGLMADLRERGVDTPVLPGILPVTSLSTMGRLGGMGAAAPAWMEERLRAADERGGADAVRKEGVELATELCSRLLESGVPGLHFYTFNTSSATREIYAALGLGPSTAP